MHWFLGALTKYLVFAGRARRAEYWNFALFGTIGSFLLAGLDGAAGTMNDSGFGLFSSVYALAMLLPGLAVSTRRVHDIGKSGWWLLIILVPLVGVVVFLYFTVIDGQPEANRYGPNPKSLPVEISGAMPTSLT